MAHWDVYIAGSMTGRQISYVLQERYFVRDLLTLYGLTYYDPAESEGLERCNPFTLISNSYNKKRMKKYVSKDLKAVSECRSILNITGDLPSEGSNWEMAYAVWYRHIPVHLVAPLRVKGSKMTFTNILVDGLHKDLMSAIKAIKRDIKENQ